MGFLDGIPKLLAALPDFNARMAATLAQSAVRDVHARIVETGKDADGKPLLNAKAGRPYSAAELPIGVFYNADIPLPRKKTDPRFMAYVEYKRQIGRDVGFRNMNLTGRMWGNTGLTGSNGTRTSFYALVKGRTQEAQDKLDRNAETSETDPLALSEGEQDRLAAIYDKELQVLLDDTLG